MIGISIYTDTFKKVPLDFEVHLDEICDVRKLCAQLVSAKFKQKRRPLSPENWERMTSR